MFFDVAVMVWCEGLLEVYGQRHFRWNRQGILKLCVLLIKVSRERTVRPLRYG